MNNTEHKNKVTTPSTVTKKEKNDETYIYI